MNIKDRVQDSDHDEPDDAVVILTPEKPIADWEAMDDVTVADQNPDYAKDELVIVVAFQHQLEEELDWQDMPADQLFQAVCDAGIKFYGFPETRLNVVETVAPEGGTG